MFKVRVNLSMFYHVVHKLSSNLSNTGTNTTERHRAEVQAMQVPELNILELICHSNIFVNYCQVVRERGNERGYRCRNL